MHDQQFRFDTSTMSRNSKHLTFFEKTKRFETHHNSQWEHDDLHDLRTLTKSLEAASNLRDSTSDQGLFFAHESRVDASTRYALNSTQKKEHALTVIDTLNRLSYNQINLDRHFSTSTSPKRNKKSPQRSLFQSTMLPRVPDRHEFSNRESKGRNPYTLGDIIAKLQ